MESDNAYATPNSSSQVEPKSAKRKWPTLIEILTALGFLLVLAWMFTPTVGTPRHVARHLQCRNNLRQIANAILSYEGQYGHFPPAYVADENGKPVHSWRVLILPFLDQQALFDRYDMDEPWDGPNNSKLHGEIADQYRCPSSDADPQHTDYVLITGKGTGFESDQTIRFGDILDGSSNSMMATEIACSKIHWMQPQDISQKEFLASVGEDKKSATNHHEAKNVIYFDGSTHTIHSNAAPKNLKKWVTIAGGEVIDSSDP